MRKVKLRIAVDPTPIGLILGIDATASLPIDHFSDVLGRLPPDLDLDALAFETKAIEPA
jgi:hypothetical protein